MIPFDEAWRLVKENTETLGLEDIGLENALGYILAEDVASDVDMPPFNKSLRDGYALRAQDIKIIPTTLKVLGESKAGLAFDGKVSEGETVQIMTGAPVPEGANAVVMIEDTEQTENGKVEINTTLDAGTWVTPKAEDVQLGEVVLRQGQLIREAEISVLATVGKDQVKVYRKPKVAVIVTGDELVSVGEKPTESKIRDSIGPYLVSMIQRDGFEVDNIGIVGDDIDALKNAVKRGLESDLVILSGGVSAGKYDYVPEVLKSFGIEEIFHKVKIKPGKPTFLGKAGQKLFFGMPGNPISTFLNYKVFVRLALDRMKGLLRSKFLTEKGMLKGSVNRERRRVFVPASITKSGDDNIVRLAGWRGSADVFSLSRSNAFMIVEIGDGAIFEGEEVEFFKW